MRIGIIAALPGELKPLVRMWKAAKASDGTRVWTYTKGEDAWVATCSGMGAEAVRRAFTVAEADGALDMVLSVGWAGALIPEVKAGESYTMSSVTDAQTGEQFHLTEGKRKLKLVTTAHVANAAEKARLRSSCRDAVMVDMEAATVARLAQMRGIPFACIKGVSDGLDARLPDINPFITAKGQLRLMAFVAHVGVRPWYWRAMAELGRNSAKAAEEMCKVILQFMEERNGRDFPANHPAVRIPYVL